MNMKSWIETDDRRKMLCECKAENHACYMQKKVVLAMTRKILRWLQGNVAQLQDIDYVDNVCDHCDVKTSAYQKSDFRTAWWMSESDPEKSSFSAKCWGNSNQILIYVPVIQWTVNL